MSGLNEVCAILSTHCFMILYDFTEPKPGESMSGDVSGYAIYF